MLFLTTLSTVQKDLMSVDGKHHMEAGYYHDTCISGPCIHQTNMLNKIRLLQRMSVINLSFFFLLGFVKFTFKSEMHSSNKIMKLFFSSMA